jgi:signal transduction histidine kinase
MRPSPPVGSPGSPTRTARRESSVGEPREASPQRSRLASRWSFRATIIAVLLVPLLTLTVMWIVATWVTVSPGLALLDAQTSVEAVGRPAQSLITELQTERRLAVTYLAGDGSDDTALRQQRGRTDAAVADFRARADTDDARAALTDVSSARLSEVLLHLDSLTGLRSGVDTGAIDRPEALRRYTQVVESALSLSRSLIRVTNEDLLREAQALMAMSEARELLSREDAVVSGTVAAGVLTTADLTQAVTLIGAQRHQFGLASTDLHVTDRLAYEQIATSAPAGTLGALENQLITEGRAGEAPPVDGAAWGAAYDDLTDRLRILELEAAERLIERSRPEATFIFGRIAVTGLLGLIALVVAAFGSVRVAGSVLRRLAGLRQAALEIAIDRLPRVVERLRRGERVDVATEAPPLPYGSDEIGQVGHAFNALQRTAVASAVAEADLRRGVNEVFLNIARRSQALLHRQLSILDGMERRAEDPVELDDLFRVDHLATRMRRNAEYLVILAGAAPGRGWRMPVPLVDVLRGAVSEVEDYARVAVRPVPDVSIAGRAVGDVIHLLAELIENAATFSPPTTKVIIGAEAVTNGLAIEIEDRGIGILPPILRELNDRLANPPDFDPNGGAQLGLFVVSRLAARHGVEVQLRKSAYGGTTAVALLPDALLTISEEPAALPAGSTPPELLPLTSASPHAPRSAGPAVGFTPVSGQGEPLPSRRPGLTRLEDAETAVIIATTGKPIGRHSRREIIEAAEDDGLPKRVRQREQRVENGADPATAVPTQPDDARSPEQIRAMMSSIQDGTARGRQEAEADDPAVGGDDGALADGGQSGTGTTGATSGGGARRRGADGGADEVLEAT